MKHPHSLQGLVLCDKVNPLIRLRNKRGGLFGSQPGVKTGVAEELKGGVCLTKRLACKVTTAHQRLIWAE
jgi:hypothetical protein